MPSLAAHKAAAKRYASLYEAIPKEHPEGRVLAAFYCALHLVEMVAASEGVHNRNHDHREAYIRAKHRTMWKHYHPLWQASEQARYLAGGGFTMSHDQLDRNLRRRHLRAFELWSQRLLGADEPPLEVEVRPTATLVPDT